MPRREEFEERIKNLSIPVGGITYISDEEFPPAGTRSTDEALSIEEAAGIASRFGLEIHWTEGAGFDVIRHGQPLELIEMPKKHYLGLQVRAGVADVAEALDIMGKHRNPDWHLRWMGCEHSFQVLRFPADPDQKPSPVEAWALERAMTSLWREDHPAEQQPVAVRQLVALHEVAEFAGARRATVTFQGIRPHGRSSMNSSDFSARSAE
jgi:hypothetical protein